MPGRGAGGRRTERVEGSTGKVCGERSGDKRAFLPLQSTTPPSPAQGLPHLVEGTGFVRRLLHRHEEGEVQLVLLLDVVPQPRQQHQCEEALCQARVQVGHKELGGLQVMPKVGRNGYEHVYACESLYHSWNSLMGEALRPHGMASPRRTSNTACGLHPSGSVRYRISSQFFRLGMILKALGIFPTVYRLSSFPTPRYTCTTLSSRPSGSSSSSSSAPALQSRNAKDFLDRVPLQRSTPRTPAAPPHTLT